MISRILVVGYGSIGRRHAAIARRNYPDVEIALLRHQILDQNKPKGITEVFDNMHDALAFMPDIAVIANPATKHLDTAFPLAEAGIHLLIEKPISHSVTRVYELLRVCEENNVVLMVGYNLRYMDSFKYFKRAVEQGAVGHPLSARLEAGQYLPSWRPNIDYRESVSANAALGGGVLLELSHEIDYALSLFGKVQWVSARIMRQSSLEIDVEDAAHINIGFVPTVGRCPVIANLNLDFFRHDKTRSCVVIGDEGSVRWNGVDGTVAEYLPSDEDWRVIFTSCHKSEAGYVEEWQHFINAIECKTTPLTSGQHAIEVLSVIQAARESSKVGRVVAVTS